MKCLLWWFSLRWRCVCRWVTVHFLSSYCVKNRSTLYFPDKSRFTSSDSDVSATSLCMNGCKVHFQVTDKFDASIDADAWCNSTGQNPCIWFGRNLAAASQTLDVNGPQRSAIILCIAMNLNVDYFSGYVVCQCILFCQSYLHVIQLAYYSSPPMIVAAIFSTFPQFIALYWNGCAMISSLSDL